MTLKNKALTYDQYLQNGSRIILLCHCWIFFNNLSPLATKTGNLKLLQNCILWHQTDKTKHHGVYSWYFSLFTWKKTVMSSLRRCWSWGRWCQQFKEPFLLSLKSVFGHLILNLIPCQNCSSFFDDILNLFTFSV